MLVAEKKPQLIPIKKLVELSNSNDIKIRESVIKILGLVGGKSPAEAIAILKKAMNDSDWSIKTAATESLAKLSNTNDASADGILVEIKKMMGSNEKWTRLKAIEVLAEIGERSPEKIHKLMKLDEMTSIITNSKEDVDIRIAAMKVFGILINAI